MSGMLREVESILDRADVPRTGSEGQALSTPERVRLVVTELHDLYSLHQLVRSDLRATMERLS